MTAIYINGFSATCAQGSDCAQISATLFSTPNAPTLIETIPNSTENAVCYFPAFSKKRLSLAELGDEIIKHITITLQESQWRADELPDIPIFLSSTSFSMAEHEIRFLEMDADELTRSYEQQTFSLNEISAYLQNRWPTITIINMATSCTSSANALLYASRYIQMGLIKRAIVVGFESFNAITLEGFRSLGLLSSTLMAPFSIESEGLVLGEGIGCVAISDVPQLCQTKQIMIAGGETRCDTTNITTTQVESITALFSSVLSPLKICAENITAIKAHATGSPVNDQIELQSISEYFHNNAPLLFFKPFIGHTLGACGSLELILLLLCIRAQRLPETRGNQIAIQSTHLTDSVTMDRELFLSGYYLLNYLGFGGSNTILLLEVSTV